MSEKNARPHPNTRLPLYGMVLTLVGLFALLLIPTLRRIQSAHVAERIQRIEAARFQIANALEKAHEARGYVLYKYFTHSPPRDNSSFESIFTAWKKIPLNADTLSACNSKTQEEWREGREIMTDWFRQYGRRDAKNEDMGGQEDFEKSSALFGRGISHLQAALTGAQDTQEQIREESRSIDRTQNAITIVLAAICFALALVAWFNLRGLQKGWAREREAATQLEVAVKESNHRIKNNLQVIGALLDMQMQEPGDTVPKTVLDGVVHQVHAVAAVHDFLSQEMRSDQVKGDLMLQQLVSLTASPIGLDVRLETEAVLLAVKQATALALITNELLLNSGKHGATQAHVRMITQGDRALLCVADNGPGFPDDFKPEEDAHLGLSLVETLTYHDLKGEIAFRNCGGAEIEITFPVDASSTPV